MGRIDYLLQKKLSEIELTYFPCDDNIENWE